MFSMFFGKSEQKRTTTHSLWARQFYTMLLSRDQGVTPTSICANCFFTQTSFYTNYPLHKFTFSTKLIFTQTSCGQNQILHKLPFSQTSRSTNWFLHQLPFTQVHLFHKLRFTNFYTNKPSTKPNFTQTTFFTH